MPSRNELVAYNRSPAQIATELGADLVIYQTLPDLISSVRRFNPAIEHFDCSVFTGEYVTGDISEEYLEWVEQRRREKAEQKKPIVVGEAIQKMSTVELEKERERRAAEVAGTDDTVGLFNWTGVRS